MDHRKFDDFPMKSSIQLGDFPACHLWWHQRVNPIKSHKTTIFPWFSYGFPMVYQRVTSTFQIFQVTEFLRPRHELRHGVGVYHHGLAALCLLCWGQLGWCHWLGMFSNVLRKPQVLWLFDVFIWFDIVWCLVEGILVLEVRVISCAGSSGFNLHLLAIRVSGWWFQPIWKILVNWDDKSQYMEK